MADRQTGFLACFNDFSHAVETIDLLTPVTLSAHVLSTTDDPQELVDTRVGSSGLLTGLSAGAAIGVGFGALSAILLPGIGAVVLTGILASAAGFGSAGAAVGGLLGAFSGDESVEKTVQFIHDSIRGGKSIVVVETSAASHDSAVLLCQSAGAIIRDLSPAETAGLEQQFVETQLCIK